MTEALTSPENYAERLAMKRIRNKIIKCGGCRMCVNRNRETDGLGRSVCTRASRSFPLCMKDGEKPGFVLDEVAK